MTTRSDTPPQALRAALLLAGLVLAGCAGEAAQPADDAAAPAAGAATLAAAEAPGAVPADSVLVTVYKNPNCGCCKKWVAYMRENGFHVVAHDARDLPAIKAEHGVPAALRSCHTAVVGDYVIEGHVPADLVRRLLAEHPDIAGLAVPGMPMGTPGMEGPRKDPYDVMAFRDDGTAEVYASR